MWHALKFLLIGLYDLTSLETTALEAKPPPKNAREKCRIKRQLCFLKASAHPVGLASTVLTDVTAMRPAPRGFLEQT